MIRTWAHLHFDRSQLSQSINKKLKMLKLLHIYVGWLISKVEWKISDSFSACVFLIELLNDQLTWGKQLFLEMKFSCLNYLWNSLSVRHWEGSLCLSGINRLPDNLSKKNNLVLFLCLMFFER